MKKIPLTILNGFLGAGKTTLLRSLLKQAHQQSLSVSVIVNDMSVLDVDGVLVANTEVVSKAQNNFITLTGTSISSNEGIKQLDQALNQLLDGQTPDLVLLETSGSSHPLPLVMYFDHHPRIQLNNVLSLVDAVMLNTDFEGGQSLIPRLQKNLQSGTRGIENLLAEQIMFSSHLLMTKNDRLPPNQIPAIAQAIHPLNPYIPISSVPWGQLKIDELMAAADYDFHRVGQLIKELETEIQDTQPNAPGQSGEITSRVIRDDRPFHPQRLWDTCHHFLPREIYRSKGFFWLPGRDEMALLWNQAAGSISLEFVSYWRSAVLERSRQQLTPEEIDSLEAKVAETSGRFGDRHCELTIIGVPDQVDAFSQALTTCFLTDEEIRLWQNGGKFDDPWPQQFANL